MAEFNSFFAEAIKGLDNQYAGLAAGGVAGDITGYIDTGCYVLNAQLSGDIHGGMPSNKAIGLAGEASTGKTFIALSIVKHFLDTNPTGGTMYFESESALSKAALEERGIDTNRIVIIPVSTIQEFRTQALGILDKYEKMKAKDRPPMLFVLDSLGQLSTTKEVEDSAAGKETRDMTKAQVTKATFRVLDLKMGILNVPMIVTNHIYDVIGAYMPTKKMGSGCLVAGTLVLSNNGYVPIESLSIDDMVMTKEGEYKKVLGTHFFDNKPILEIELENGFVIKCTPNHKFYVNGEWVAARDLSLDMVLEAV